MSSVCRIISLSSGPYPKRSFSIAEIPPAVRCAEDESLLTAQQPKVSASFSGGQALLEGIPPGLVLPESLAMPADDGGGRDDDQGVLPSGPDSPEPDLEEPLEPAQARPLALPFEDGQLLAQSQVP